MNDINIHRATSHGYCLWCKTRFASDLQTSFCTQKCYREYSDSESELVQRLQRQRKTIDPVNNLLNSINPEFN